MVPDQLHNFFEINIATQGFIQKLLHMQRSPMKTGCEELLTALTVFLISYVSDCGNAIWNILIYSYHRPPPQIYRSMFLMPPIHN